MNDQSNVPATAAEAKPPSQAAVLRHQLDGMNDQFKAALPAHIPVERFARVVMTAVQANPDLMRCDRRSLFQACMKAAQDGLLPDGREGAIVVRKARDGFTANWQVMIAGIRKKARNSGEIATWDAHIVRKGDHFQFQLGDNPQINHTYDLSTERGDIVGAYSVCTLKDGQKSYEVMTIGEIRAIRDRSDAWKAYKAGKIKSTPWSTDEGEMARKTVARRHSKVLPMSTDLDDLIRRDDDLYDFRETREETHADRPRSLAGRLDALAAPPVVEEGETIDAETGEITAGTDADDAPDYSTGEADAPEPPPVEGDAPTTASDVQGDKSPIEEWTEEQCKAYGRKAHSRGMARKAAVPPHLREEGQESRAAAVLAGFDEAKRAKEPAEPA